MCFASVWSWHDTSGGAGGGGNASGDGDGEVQVPVRAAARKEHERMSRDPFESISVLGHNMKHE